MWVIGQRPSWVGHELHRNHKFKHRWCGRTFFRSLAIAGYESWGVIRIYRTNKPPSKGFNLNPLVLGCKPELKSRKITAEKNCFYSFHLRMDINRQQKTMADILLITALTKPDLHLACTCYDVKKVNICSNQFLYKWSVSLQLTQPWLVHAELLCGESSAPQKRWLSSITYDKNILAYSKNARLKW